jgi:hypothetical protein
MMRGLDLTTDVLAATWDYLRLLPPFDGWRCYPKSHKVRFAVMGANDTYGDFAVENFKPIVRVSSATVGFTGTLLSVMSHEMAHYRQWHLGQKLSHGRSFIAMRRAICSRHGFDPKTF